MHFIAGIKDEYNKIAFSVKGLNPGVISKVG